MEAQTPPGANVKIGPLRNGAKAIRGAKSSDSLVLPVRRDQDTFFVHQKIQ